MKTTTLSGKLALACCALCALAATQVQASLVTWDFNPTNANASVGSASHTFTSGGYSITAYGYDAVNGPDTPHTLYYKDVDLDHGLGLVGTPHNEIQADNYIQMNLSGLLSLGFTNGQIKISSVDPGESFNLYGSNTLGQLGMLLLNGSSTNNTWINMPSFGTYQYVSVIANQANQSDVLVWGVRASVTPIPEPEATSLIAAVIVAAAATAFEARRQRQARRQRRRASATA